MSRRQGIPKEERIGIAKISPKGGAVMLILDNGLRGMISVKSMQKLLSKAQPYTVIRIPKFAKEGGQQQ